MKFQAILSTLLFAGAGGELLAQGKQLTGVYAPTGTPALPPAQAQKQFVVPAGFEMRLFAAEPDVINPVAMTWDSRGRLWVVELMEYPLGAAPGQKGRDRVKILEDSDGDGRADKVTVFAEGLNLATGILLGHGGAYVGQAPDLLFLQDTNGDDVADKRTVLKTGFGLEDRHELLNGFTWGPDGYLYMTHGVFTHSQVKDPANANDDGVTVDAAVARFQPRTGKFEVFADGTSNPWGVDFDRTGNAFVSACVIEHLFHLSAGGQYVRQGGTPANPYGYGLLPSINDHKHFRAAYAGIQVYQGNQYPAEFQGAIFMGNIHDNAVHQDSLKADGSSFKASFSQDFIRSKDGWFRPVSTQTGPDGALWIMDWYDKYPCYQNARADPEGVDRTHGRIWRAVYTGNKPGAPLSPKPAQADLAKLSSAELVKLLEHPNIWQRKMAQQLLTERGDATAAPALRELLARGQTLEARLSALWTLHGLEQLNESLLDQYVEDKEAGIRKWVARLTGEQRTGSEGALLRLQKLAADADPSVRLAVATAARQHVSGALTVNTPLPARLVGVDLGPVLTTLIRASADGKDPVLPFLIWMAVEPTVARDSGPAFAWLLEQGSQAMPLSGELTRKLVRRLCDTRSPERISEAVSFITEVMDKNAALAAAALDGLIEGQKGKALLPSIAPAPMLAKIAANAELKDRAQRLGTLWGDAAAIEGTLKTINDSQAPLPERINAIQVARQLKSEAARQAMLQLMSRDNPESLHLEGVRALSEIGGEARVAEALIGRWNKLNPAVRRAAADVLVSRASWTLALLGAIEGKTIAAADMPATVIRTLSQSKDEPVRLRASQVIGRIRAPDTDKLALITAKRQLVLAGQPDLKAGHELAQKTCLICHKLHGEGAEVGPDLTGVGRSTLDALLANVIDPNQVIGKGYENVEVETKDGRSVSGRLVEQNDARLRLLSAGPKEDVIARSDIASIRVSELSVMPEGLEQMSDADFRNLIWYILNPPQDNRPLTPRLRKELTGEDKPQAAASARAVDGESVALWNPLWKVICPDFEGAPQKLSDYAGRKNVLMTHPVSRDQASALERTVTLPASSGGTLRAVVAAHEKGDWELRVLVNSQVIHRQVISHQGVVWKTVTVDLSAYAGQKVDLRLENAANNWEYEFGYWQEIILQ